MKSRTVSKNRLSPDLSCGSSQQFGEEPTYYLPQPYGEAPELLRTDLRGPSLLGSARPAASPANGREGASPRY